MTASRPLPWSPPSWQVLADSISIMNFFSRVIRRQVISHKSMMEDGRHADIARWDMSDPGCKHLSITLMQKPTLARSNLAQQSFRSQPSPLSLFGVSQEPDSCSDLLRVADLSINAHGVAGQLEQSLVETLRQHASPEEPEDASAAAAAADPADAQPADVRALELAAGEMVRGRGEDLDRVRLTLERQREELQRTQADMNARHERNQQIVRQMDDMLRNASPNMQSILNSSGELRQALDALHRAGQSPAPFPAPRAPAEVLNPRTALRRGRYLRIVSEVPCCAINFIF